MKTISGIVTGFIALAAMGNGLCARADTPADPDCQAKVLAVIQQPAWMDKWRNYPSEAKVVCAKAKNETERAAIMACMEDFKSNYENGGFSHARVVASLDGKTPVYQSSAEICTDPKNQPAFLTSEGRAAYKSCSMKYQGYLGDLPWLGKDFSVANWPQTPPSIECLDPAFRTGLDDLLGCAKTFVSQNSKRIPYDGVIACRSEPRINTDKALRAAFLDCFGAFQRFTNTHPETAGFDIGIQDAKNLTKMDQRHRKWLQIQGATEVCVLPATGATARTPKMVECAKHLKSPDRYSPKATEIYSPETAYDQCLADLRKQGLYPAGTTTSATGGDGVTPQGEGLDAGGGGTN